MKQTKQRGSGWSIKLALWVNKNFGYITLFILLYPISFIYFIKAHNVRKSLKLYYKRIGVPFTQLKYFTHLRKFAIVTTDRFIAKIDRSTYAINIDEQQAMEDVKDGAIILFSHFGGWSATLEFLKGTSLHVNVVMQEVIKDDIKKVEFDLLKNSKQNNISIIDISKNSTLDVSIKIARALSNKEIVAMMGDRANSVKRSIELPFFGKNAKFNKTPFELAKKANLPIVAFFIIYKKPRVYEIKHILIKSDKSVEKMAMKYVASYEQIVRETPDQWFNLYDFWEESSSK